MASIQKKIKKGRTYYYAMESKRVKGKPRIIWQKYLGSVESIVKRLDQVSPPPPKETVIFEYGGVAAMLRITQQLGLIELINKYVPKRLQGPSVGHYLVLAAINRVLDPRSKVEIGTWYESSILRRLWGFPKKAFSSQRFWDHMDMVSEEAIRSVEQELFEMLQTMYSVEIDALLFDTTNFYTYIDSFNDRNTIAQRGKNKQKRHDLRQVGLALLVSKAFQIPLVHRVYTGNVADASQFYSVTSELVNRYTQFTNSTEKVTFILDKGNVSADNLDLLDDARIDVVAAVGISSAGDLLTIDRQHFQPVVSFPGTSAYRTTRELWGNERTFVVEFSESFFTQQVASVTKQMVKCERQLTTLFQHLKTWHEKKGKGKRPTGESVKKKVSDILRQQFMSTIFKVKVEEKDGLPYLQFETDMNAFHELINTRLGKTVLVTTRDEWSNEEIITAYRSLSNVEKCFEYFKDTTFLHWHPAYHWTDQKIMVHGFYCVLALMMATLTRKRLMQAGLEVSLTKMLEELTAIKETAVIYPKGSMAHRKDHITLTRMSPRQKRMAEILEIAKV